MRGAWNVRIHKLVLSEDFASIDSVRQRIVLKDVGKKLSVDPKGYGAPLRGDLSGYWRLRAGDVRVIYRIDEKDVVVLVLKVGMRRNDEVYRRMLSRLIKAGL
jgi:mRNA interferase RelE/StbE